MVAEKLKMSNKTKDLSERFKKASELQMDELDFFTELLEAGYNLRHQRRTSRKVWIQ